MSDSKVFAAIPCLILGVVSVGLGVAVIHSWLHGAPPNRITLGYTLLAFGALAVLLGGLGLFYRSRMPSGTAPGGFPVPGANLSGYISDGGTSHGDGGHGGSFGDGGGH